MRHTLLPVLVLASMLVACATKPSPVLPPAARQQRRTLSELKTRVDALLRTGDSVLIRRDVTDVFALVDLLLDAGQQAESLRYMSAALQHNAWALNYQMRYAEILNQTGEAEQAGETAALVLEYAEQDELCDRAERILKRAPLPPISAIQTAQVDTITLVLVPLGSVDRYALYEVQKELTKALSIPVLLQDARVSVPEFKRDPVRQHLAEVRSNLLAEVERDVRLASFLRGRGLTGAELQQDAAVVAACRHILFASGGANALAQFDAGMRQLALVPKQWDADDLLRSLKAAVQPFRNGKLYFMGVANLDAYMDQSNFIFGSAENGGHHAVITYRRFTAEFNGEEANRHRLVDRTVKQALSSLGFMLGIERCTTPTCARAYPHSLPEHDAKSKGLCRACRSGFERVLGFSLEGLEADQQRHP
jgi:predicted Zn-dependent protease